MFYDWTVLEKAFKLGEIYPHYLFYIYKVLCHSITFLFVLMGTNISHTQVGGTNIFTLWGGGDKHLLHTGGNKYFFYIQGGTNIFLLMMIIVETVSRANILFSEAGKPPAGTRVLGR